MAGPPPAVARWGDDHADESPVLLRTVREGAPTLIAFAGMGRGLQMPLAEFAGVLAPFDVNVVFVRDPRRAWFQHGIPGLGSSPEESAAQLRRVVPAESSIVGTVGTSSGGTGAVLFGTMLQVPAVLAFSPRTRVTADVIARWQAEFPDMPAVDPSSPTADLRAFLDGWHGHLPRIDVHIGAGSAEDVREAEHLRGVPEVRVLAHPTDWHASAAWLRQEGALPRILQDGFGLSLRPGEELDRRRHDPPPPRRDWRPGPLARAVRARAAGWRARDAR